MNNEIEGIHFKEGRESRYQCLKCGQVWLLRYDKTIKENQFDTWWETILTHDCYKKYFKEEIE